jgi:hypothetical protein
MLRAVSESDRVVSAICSSQRAGIILCEGSYTLNNPSREFYLDLMDLKRRLRFSRPPLEKLARDVNEGMAVWESRHFKVTASHHAPLSAAQRATADADPCLTRAEKLDGRRSARFAT